MNLNRFLPLLDKLDAVRIPLETRRGLIIKQAGPKILDPLMDQSLDPGDTEKICASVMKELKKTREFKDYVKVRKEVNDDFSKLLTAMKKAKAKDWTALATAEINATTKNDIAELAKSKYLKNSRKKK